jgi:hypothetical protein
MPLGRVHRRLLLTMMECMRARRQKGSGRCVMRLWLRLTSCTTWVNARMLVDQHVEVVCAKETRHCSLAAAQADVLHQEASTSLPFICRALCCVCVGPITQRVSLQRGLRLAEYHPQQKSLSEPAGQKRALALREANLTQHEGNAIPRGVTLAGLA